MPGRKAGRGSSKPSKTKASKSVKVKPVKVKPVKVKPEKVKAVKPAKVPPVPHFVAAPPRPPPKTAPIPPLTLPHRIEVAPRKSASSPWLKTSPSSSSIKSSSKPAFLSTPPAHYPPIPNKFPSSSSTPQLKSSRSVPNFNGMR